MRLESRRTRHGVGGHVRDRRHGSPQGPQRRDDPDYEFGICSTNPTCRGVQNA